MKSSSYYLFWGAATVAVVAGQIYVGAGYRQMSESVDDVVEVLTKPSPRTMPVPNRNYEMPILQ